MTRDDFLARYGAVFDHSPWVAQRAYDLPGADFLPRALAAMQTRLRNDEAAEQQTALAEIGKIAKYRLEALP